MTVDRKLHYAAKYQRVCRICKRDFLSKKKDGNVCYHERCQAMHESERRRLEYQRKKREKQTAS